MSDAQGSGEGPGIGKPPGPALPGPMPKPGTHTREILAEIGFVPAKVEDMIARGVAAEQWCDKHLPE